MTLRWFFRRPGWRGVWLGLFCALVAWGVTRVALLRGLEEWVQDGFFDLRGTRDTRARVVIIGLDDDSLDDLKKPLLYLSPELAEVVAFAATQKPAAIGLDVMVPESQQDEEGLQPGGRGDAAKLGAAILAARDVVLPERLPKEAGKRVRLPVPQWLLKHFQRKETDPPDLGFVNVTEDDDMFLRRQQLYVRDKDDPPQAHTHFALALFAVAHRAEVKWQDGTLYVGGRPVPLDDEHKLRINYVGPPRTFPVIPFRDALKAARGRGKLAVDLAGTVVIVGVTARDQQDYHSTPYANNYARYLATGRGDLMAGSEVHANILATLSDWAYLRDPHPLFALGLLLAAGAALGKAFARLSLAWGLAVAFAHHWAWKGVCFAAFAGTGWRLEAMSMLTLGFLVYTATFIQRWRRMRRMLGVVKSEAVARMIEDDPDGLDPRGKKADHVTVLFADIRTFTPYCEAHSAHEVVELLNTYFGEVVPLIEAHGGTLNQYMGDGIMVIFGAPAPCPGHALRAVQTAVAMVRRVLKLRAGWAKLGMPDLRIGVGIHSGPVVAGAVGSPRRLDYSVIGSTVNAAARLESATKELGTWILISAETYRELPAAERRALGCRAESQEVTVKGIPDPIRVHVVEVPGAGGPAAAAPDGVPATAIRQQPNP